MRPEAELVEQMLGRLGPRGVLFAGSDKAPFEVSSRHGAGHCVAVVRPADRTELAWAMDTLTRAGVSIVTQGAATGLVGSATPSTDGTQWVLSTQRLRDVLDIDPVNRSATVAAGYRLSDLNHQAQRHGLVFPIDLGADPTIGGMVATNTGGARLIRYGGVRENLLDIEALLVHPQVCWVGGTQGLRKNNTGPQWAQLLCGTFGTWGVVAGATLKLHPLPQQSATALVAVASAEAAVELLCALELAMGEFVSAFEGLSAGALEAVSRHQGHGVFASTPPYAVLLEVASAVPVGHGLAIEAMLMTWLEGQLEAGLVLDAVVDKPQQLWRVRHAVSESVQALGRLVAFDVSVSRSAFAPFRAAALELVQGHIPGALVCDFGHLGDGGVHLNAVVPEDTTGQAIQGLREAVYDLVVGRFQGSFSAEHGVGPYNQVFYDRYTPAPMRALCTVLDSHFNPGHHLGNVRLG